MSYTPHCMFLYVNVWKPLDLRFVLVSSDGYCDEEVSLFGVNEVLLLISVIDQ